MEIINGDENMIKCDICGKITSLDEVRSGLQEYKLLSDNISEVCDACDKEIYKYREDLHKTMRDQSNKKTLEKIEQMRCKNE